MTINRRQFVTNLSLLIPTLIFKVKIETEYIEYLTECTRCKKRIYRAHEDASLLSSRMTDEIEFCNDCMEILLYRMMSGYFAFNESRANKLLKLHAEGK